MAFHGLASMTLFKALYGRNLPTFFMGEHSFNEEVSNTLQEHNLI